MMEMKTLNEVIEALEICSQMDADCDKCPYKATAKGWCEEKDRDALHYLKEYKGLSKMWNDRLDKEQDNSPLTWDELKVMEGKPVWVERPEWKEWLLISEIDEGKCEIYLRDKWGNGAIVNGRNIGYWQAYRKERQNVQS